MPRPGRWRTVLLGFAVALTYFLLAQLAKALAGLYDGYAPFWPAAGAASGALMVLGLRFAPAVALGALASCLAQDYPAATVPWFVAVDTGEAVLVAALVRRTLVTPGLRRPRDVVWLAALGVLGGCVSASLAAPVYAGVSLPGTTSLASLWLGWTVGNAIGHLVIGGTLLAWAAGAPTTRMRATGLEQAAIFTVTVGLSGWIFLADGPSHLQRPYLVLALITWTAVRLGQRAVSLAILIAVGLAAAAVMRATGPFATLDGVGLQVFVAVCGLAGFGVAAVAAEREDIAAASDRDARYRLLADASPNFMWSGTSDGNIDFYNQHALNYTGLSAEQACGLAWLDLLHPDDVERAMGSFTKASATLSTCAEELRVRRADGEYRWHWAVIAPTRDVPGTAPRWIGAASDIHDRKMAEEQRQALEQSLRETQKLESLGVLTGGIAHDFNNLLVGILGNASLALLDLAPGSAVRAAVERIETSSLRAADLIRQMLAYSGRSTLTMETVDVAALVTEMSDLLGTAISKKAVVRYELADGLPAVKGDPTQLRQVVMNLITNASEALPDEGGAITVATALVESHAPADAPAAEFPGGRAVQISVADTGAGMDAATQARIFDPFFTTKFTGRGLGLAAVQGIVRAHHGTIRVESAPGRGTCVTVLLPALTAPATPRPGPAAPSSLRGIFSGTALVIDDEDAVRVAMTLMLERFGFAVSAAANGRQGLAQFVEHRAGIRLVVLDLTMPDMSGAEVLSALRALDREVPVLLVSGYGKADAARAAGHGHACAFLQKPFTPHELARAIDAALAGTPDAHGRRPAAAGVTTPRGPGTAPPARPA